MDEPNDVEIDKKSMLDELKKAFARCSYFLHRSHRVSISQRMEFAKTMAYISQVITSHEKDILTRDAEKTDSKENNMAVLHMLHKDGVIEIKDEARLRQIFGTDAKITPN